MKKDSFASNIILLLFIVFFTSIFFAFRAISSVSIAALLLAGIIKNRSHIKRNIFRSDTRFLILACLVFFLMQFVSLLLSGNTEEGWKNISHKSGLIIIPLAVILAGPFNGTMWKYLLRSYCILLAIASLYCFFMAFLYYSDSGNTTLFFYHQLVKPLHQHAIYFSIYVFIALIFLMENLQNKSVMGGNKFSIPLIVFFSVLLFFLSSKLVITFYLFYLIYYSISYIKNNNYRRGVWITIIIAVPLLAGIIFFTRNPVSNRFRDIFKGDLAIVEQEKYNQGVYLNGIQFRLLQWRLVTEILTRHKDWWTGAGAANAQLFLNEEYIEKDMYIGTPERGDIGYRAYNTHNEFLESLLRNGIPGMLAFSLIFFALIKIAWKKKQRSITFIILLLLVYSIVESILETQYGIVLFTFFPAFLCQREKESQPSGTLSRF
jgi:O-antigen ligase